VSNLSDEQQEYPDGINIGTEEKAKPVYIDHLTIETSIIGTGRHKMVDTKELRKAAAAVFLAVEESVAYDLSKKLIEAADEIDKLRGNIENDEDIEVDKMMLPAAWAAYNKLVKEGKINP